MINKQNLDAYKRIISDAQANLQKAVLSADAATQMALMTAASTMFTQAQCILLEALVGQVEKIANPQIVMGPPPEPLKRNNAKPKVDGDEG